MAIAERIKFMRKRKGLTQKELGLQVGFGERTADIRIAQYESGTRAPKEKLTEAIAYRLGVSPWALDVPNIESYYNLIHTLFALEDLYGLTIATIDGEPCLTLDKNHTSTYSNMHDMFFKWSKEAERYRLGEISKEEYDNWRYTYPEVEAARNKKALDILRLKMKEEEQATGQAKKTHKKSGIAAAPSG